MEKIAATFSIHMPVNTSPIEKTRKSTPMPTGIPHKKRMWGLTMKSFSSLTRHLTKNGSVAGRPRGVALSQEYTSAAGVAGQLQPLVRSHLYAPGRTCPSAIRPKQQVAKRITA